LASTRAAAAHLDAIVDVPFAAKVVAALTPSPQRKAKIEHLEPISNLISLISLLLSFLFL
jgi:hypothetical protein